MNLAYEKARSKSLERKVRALILAGLIKDIVIIGLVILGLIKLIGG